jgi:AhpD family alkylhydroperoxidase
VDARLNIYENPVSVKFLRHIRAASQSIHSSLPAVTRELVSLRVSQINGCGFCVDMHVKEAEQLGETGFRLHMVAAWREANVFSDAERAALDLAEQGTRIADAAGGVTDEAWATAVEHYDEDQLAALVSLISFMNVVNRMNVIARQPGGGYQLGWRSSFE